MFKYLRILAVEEGTDAWRSPSFGRDEIGEFGVGVRDGRGYAIDQIKRKEYFGKEAQYTGDILLVGISYDKKEKRHSCVMETVSK